MRIDTLTVNNAQTQGARRRETINRQSPQHLENATTLMVEAMKQRPYSASRSTLVLGAGACTEVPLAALVHHSDEVVLADLDLISMQQARAELSAPAMRKQVHLIAEDMSGGVSASLDHLLARQSWYALAEQGARAIFDAAASCLDACPIPDPPEIAGLLPTNFGVVISSLILSQLFSYPLLDVLDRIERVVPNIIGEQERHHRYQEASQGFRVRIIQAHLHLLKTLLDQDGLVVLLCDQRGFVFDASEQELSTNHRRSIPLVPRAFFDLIDEYFTILEKREWEWITDLPGEGRYGRGYSIVGYLLKSKEMV